MAHGVAVSKLNNEAMSYSLSDSYRVILSHFTLYSLFRYNFLLIDCDFFILLFLCCVQLMLVYGLAMYKRPLLCNPILLCEQPTRIVLILSVAVQKLENCEKEKGNVKLELKSRERNGK